MDNMVQKMIDTINLNYSNIQRIDNRLNKLFDDVQCIRDEVEKCHRGYIELRKQSLTTIESVNEYLSVYQLSHYIPSHPMASTIRTWCCQDKIPHHKMNGKLVFLKNEIDEWLKSKL